MALDKAIEHGKEKRKPYDMGHACTALMSDGQITWMVGNDPDCDMCECYEPKEAKS